MPLLAMLLACMVTLIAMHRSYEAMITKRVDALIDSRIQEMQFKECSCEDDQN